MTPGLCPDTVGNFFHEEGPYSQHDFALKGPICLQSRPFYLGWVFEIGGFYASYDRDAMSAPILETNQEYETLRRAAETFGFRREAELIAQKADDDQSLFTLLVAGQRGVGKSTIINQLLGRNIASVNTPNHWLNIYRRPENSREFAEVFYRNSSPPQKILIQQALALTRKENLPSTDLEEPISRIVWHINAPGLPLKVAIAELPDTTALKNHEALLWKADGVIVVFRANQINDETLRRDVEWLNEQQLMPLSSMGVVTYMDTIPRKRWIQVLQYARTRIGNHLDVVVPCSNDPDELDIVLADTNALLHREVRNRFFASASTLRQKNQELFAQSMRTSLAGQFEIYVDRVLQNRWAFQQFRDSIDDQLETLGSELRTRYQRYITDQKNQALARAAAMDSFHFDEPEREDATQKGPTSAEFARDIYSYISQSTQRLFSSLAYEELPAGSMNVAISQLRSTTEPRVGNTPAISFKYPKLPEHTLALLQGEIAPVEIADPLPTQRVEAGMFGSEEEPISAPVPVDRWVTATEWLPTIMQKAEEEMNKWLSETIGQLRHNLLRSAEQTFRAVHGFLPSDAPLVLMPLEETYGFLHHTPVRVPTPHLPGEHLSPALFLCRMQEPEFVDLWNRQLIQRCYEFTIPRLEKQLSEDISNVREQLNEQWAGSIDSIHKRVDIVWKKYGRRLALKSAVKWSIPWVSTLMRDRLMDPVQYLARSRKNVRAPYEYPVSLYLHSNSGEFLQPLDKPVERPLTPDQFIVDLVQQKIRKSAANIWRSKKAILVSLPLRKIVRRRTALSIGVLFGFAMIWIMLFGTSNVSMIALGVLAFPYIVITGALIKRLIDRMYESGSEVQAEKVFHQIQNVVHERLDNVRRHVMDEIRDDELRDEVIYALREKQTLAVGTYLPYKELIKRLRSMEERKKNRAANAA